jgi:acetate kinase
MIAGRSVATTMGFSPLSGLVMTTRPGEIDPGLILWLMRERGMDADAIEALLYRRSGLLGVSGLSGDMRELLASSDPGAREAVDLFVYRAARELGSLAAAAGGLDAFVFTGGIGERSAPIRKAICRASRWLGIEIDDEANAGGTGRISATDSAVSVWVVPTDEERMIARHTAATIAAP